MFLEPPFKAWEEPEQDREPALAEQLGQFVRAARGAFSDSTERALRSDLAIYAEWCAERGERPLPAKPETIAAFVDAKAELRAPATVRRYVTSIGIAQRALGLEKTVKSPPVQLALKRMHRKKGRRQDQATGLTWPLRQRLLEAAGDRSIDDRNRALLAVAYDAMLRRAELVSLQVPDLLVEAAGRRQPAGPPLQDRLRGHGRDRLGRSGHRPAGAGVARPRRDIRRHAVPLGRQGRAGRRPAASLPGAAHLQGDGARGRPAGSGGWRASRATAPGSERPRIWWPPASSCRRSSTPGGGSPRRW